MKFPVFPLLPLFACSVHAESGSGDSGLIDSGGARGDAAADARTLRDAGKPDALDGCNALTLRGPLVLPTLVSGNPPASTGGTIENGTYNATALTIYSADSELPVAIKQYQETAQITPGTWQSVFAADGVGGTQSAAMVQIDAGSNWSVSCPEVADLNWQYSADAKTLTLTVTNAATATASEHSVVYRFEREP